MDITHKAQLRLSLRPKPEHNDGNAYIALHFRRGKPTMLHQPFGISDV
jgi:hypothetical protein